MSPAIHQDIKSAAYLPAVLLFPLDRFGKMTTNDAEKNIAAGVFLLTETEPGCRVKTRFKKKTNHHVSHLSASRHLHLIRFDQLKHLLTSFCVDTPADATRQFRSRYPLCLHQSYSPLFFLYPPPSQLVLAVYLTLFFLGLEQDNASLLESHLDGL